MNHIDIISDCLITEIENNTKVRVSDKATMQSCAVIWFNKNHGFCMEISDDCAVIKYCDECDVFFAQTYKNDNEYINSVVSYINHLTEGGLLYECLYFRDKLLRYKIWSCDSNNKRLVKRVSVSRKGLFYWKSIRKEYKYVDLLV